MTAPVIPSKIVQPFGQNAPDALINPIPLTTSTFGRASFDAGFSQPNFDPVASGGQPPFGADFNGLLNQVTAWLRWVAAGGPIDYDGTFAADANLGGYPLGAVLTRSLESGNWLNLIDGNTTDPEAGGAGWELIGSEITLVLNDGVPVTLTTLDSTKSYTVEMNTLFSMPVAADMRNGVNFSFLCEGGTATLQPDPAAKIDGGGVGEAYTFPDGTGGFVKRDDSSNWSIFYFSGPGTGIYTTASLVVRPGNKYLLDCSDGSFNLTLPPFGTSPQSLDFEDVAQSLGNPHAVTLVRNGGTGTIQGIAENCRLNISGLAGTIVTDGNGPNWRLV